MIYAVFLCDRQWEIRKIQQCDQRLGLEVGQILTEQIAGKERLQDLKEGQTSLEMEFLEEGQKIPATLQVYKEGVLIVLSQIESNAEFLEFCKLYPEYQEWAKDCLFGLFHDEYYMIQQMNNQLIDAQRKLTRSNRRLERALKENQEINEQLDEARQLAEKASRSKTRFLANMSHDIRTPMNAIFGLTELMRHNLDNPEILKEYISKLKSSSQYLLDLINDILELSKIETESMELKMEPMDLAKQIEQVVTIIRPKITEKNQKLSVDGENVEYRYLMGDPLRFRQILMNIFSNAVKYTPQGGNIRFAISETGRTDTARGYEFVIEDNGIGMSPEFVQHIFDPFARAVDEVREIQGTGLGMAITKNIVDAMDGAIRVESEQGKGSRFIINLSFAICKDKEEVVEEKVEEESFSIRGKRFLCAEDNELNAEILSSMMELEGAKCKIYSNGKLLTDAFERIMPGEYDAILMDVQMPVMNGYEAAKRIRNGSNPLGKTIPIIAMSANAFQEDIDRSLEAGMNAHVSKPMDMKKLRTVLSKEL